MDLVLFSERLKLTPLAMSDADITIELFTNPAVVEYAMDEMTVEEVHDNMGLWTKRGGNGCIGIWCVSNRDTDEKLGSVALLPMPVEEDDTDFDLVVPGEMPDGDVEVGFFLKQSAWGNGYATEACKRIVQFAFDQSPLTEIVATFDEENLASKHVLEKSGFVNCGTMRSYGEDGPNYRVSRPTL